MSITTPKPPYIYHYNSDSQPKINVNYNCKTITLVLDNPNQQNNKIINYNNINSEEWGWFYSKTNTLLHGQYCVFSDNIYEIKNYLFGCYISSESKPIQPFIFPGKLYQYIDDDYKNETLFHIINKPLLYWLLYRSIFLIPIEHRPYFIASKIKNYSINL